MARAVTTSARVLLSALADESAFNLTATEQFTALAAIGLEYYSLRFIDVGKGVKNVMKLSISEIQKLRHLEDQYGLNVASIASPIGKIKLVDKPDGTKNAYVPFKQYLAKDVAKACELAHAFETKLIRGFSFYPPKSAKGFSTAEVYRQWEAMKPGLGWVHIKDYRKVSGQVRGKHVNEHTLDSFVPADAGVGGHDRILADLRGMLPALTKKLQRRGIPGVFLDLEPHVRGGGQFGGTSGPDGMGIALRALCRVLDKAKVDYHLRDFEDLLAARGL